MQRFAGRTRETIRFARLITAVLVAGLAACDSTPTSYATGRAKPFGLRLSALIQADDATAVDVRVFYQRTAGEVDLLNTVIPLPVSAGTPLAVDITDCLTDAQRAPIADDACPIGAELTLRRGNVELDRTKVGLVAAHAGEDVSMPAATLYEIATVDVVATTSGLLAVEPETTLVLKAVAKDKSGAEVAGHAAVWTSSNPSIASVDPSSGVVSSISAGIASIAATAGGRTGQATLQVLPFAARRVVVSPRAMTVSAGSSAPLTFSAFDRKNRALSGRAATWTSSNSSVAVVSTAGSVGGVAAGTAAITANVDGATDASTVTVTPSVVSSVSISFGSASIAAGQTTQAAAIARDASGNTLSGKSANAWRSSDPSIASVNASGLVSAVAPGSVAISATVDGITGAGTLVVTGVAVASIRVSLPLSNLVVGQTTQATASVRDANDNEIAAPVTWASSNAGVATVSATGLVTGVAAGSADITATSGNKTGVVTLSVQNQSSGFLLRISGGGTGAGTVVSNIGGINCSISAGGTAGACSASFATASSVLLTATASGSSTFSGWSGAPSCGSGTTCTVSVTQIVGVTASFTAPVVNYTISASASPAGTGSVNGGGIYASGTTATVTATAASGFAFKNWTEGGSEVSTNASYPFTVAGNRTLVANFLPTYTLTVDSDGDPGGMVTSSPAGISCPSFNVGNFCHTNFRSGNTVALTVATGPVTNFLGWSGDCTGTATTCTVVMTQARSAVARFLFYLPPTLSGFVATFVSNTSPGCPSATLYQLTVNVANNFGPQAMMHSSVSLSMAPSTLVLWTDSWSGTAASGTLTINACVVFGSATSGTFALALFNSTTQGFSNIVSAVVSKPPGSP